MLMARRRPRRGRAPTRRRGTRAGCRTPTGRRTRGPTPRSCAHCRRPSPSTAPRSRRPEAMWRARRNTPGAPSSWPAPTTTSRGAARPGSSDSPPGREGDVSTALETFTPGRGQPARRRQPRRRAEQHRCPGRHVARRGPTEQGAPALPSAPCSGPRPQAQPVARATADLHVGLGEIDVESGDLESARRHLEDRRRLGRPGWRSSESRYRWFVAMGLARRRRRRPAGGHQPPGPGGAALPARILPGRATHRRHQGPDLDRAGQARRGR